MNGYETVHRFVPKARDIPARVVPSRREGEIDVEVG
jgi:hypothetical protein